MNLEKTFDSELLGIRQCMQPGAAARPECDRPRSQQCPSSHARTKSTKPLVRLLIAAPDDGCRSIGLSRFGSFYPFPPLPLWSDKLRQGQSSSLFSDRSGEWSVGVMKYWSGALLHHSITPPLRSISRWQLRHNGV